MSRGCHFRAALLLVLMLLAAMVAPRAWGQKKKAAGQTREPQILLTSPLGVQPGKTATITIRGNKLDTAMALEFPEPNATAKGSILRRGKANVPDKSFAKFGDTEIVAEIKVPSGLPSGTLSIIVVTPDGKTKAHALLVESELPVVGEKEPNDGFRQAQPIFFPQVVDGTIERPQDVDVFRFEGKAGQRVIFEVLAARHGSALDSLLTLYDADGRQLASNDDTATSIDSHLETVLPREGVYYISLMDAHDQGGPAHVYRLVARTQQRK
jgi:hypothetical protein